MKPKHVRILKRGDRGFHGYGKPMTDSYGSVLEVYESSSAEGPHVWLSVDSSSWENDQRAKRGSGTAHLNAAQARDLIARLQTWLDEIPKRWEGR